MAKPSIEPGAQLDGFTIGERVHQGGMATLWSVTHPGIDVPLLMKVPLTSEGEDPAAIVSFEMEQMILPRLSGPHVPVQLLGGRRWLAVVGSVGQPRDGDPAASFAMFDTASRELTYCRVPYDIETAAERIRANGLPRWLADRLREGR